MERRLEARRARKTGMMGSGGICERRSRSTQAPQNKASVDRRVGKLGRVVARRRAHLLTAAASSPSRLVDWRTASMPSAPAVSSCEARSTAGATRAALLMLRAVLRRRKRPVFFGVAIYAFTSIVGGCLSAIRPALHTQLLFADLFSVMGRSFDVLCCCCRSPCMDPRDSSTLVGLS